MKATPTSCVKSRGDGRRRPIKILPLAARDNQQVRVWLRRTAEQFPVDTTAHRPSALSSCLWKLPKKEGERERERASEQDTNKSFSEELARALARASRTLIYGHPTTRNGDQDKQLTGCPLFLVAAHTDTNQHKHTEGKQELRPANCLSLGEATRSPKGRASRKSSCARSLFAE